MASARQTRLTRLTVYRAPVCVLALSCEGAACSMIWMTNSGGSIATAGQPDRVGQRGLQ